MGCQIMYYSVLWVANYQTLRTTALDRLFVTSSSNFMILFKKWKIVKIETNISLLDRWNNNLPG